MMTERQQSIVWDLNGRGWCVLVPNNRSIFPPRTDDVIILNKQGVVHRITSEGRLVVLADTDAEPVIS